MTVTSPSQTLTPTHGGAGPSERADGVRRRELGAFLRSRRERISPDHVGLPPGGRRRTPGLRREEVAALAGVGVTWYTWLEQGRDIHVSDDVLEAISRTLLFDPHEHRHLFALAGSGGHRVQTDCQSLSPAIQVILDGLGPLPACVLNARFDVLAFNRAYGELITDIAALPFEDRNTLWLHLTDPAWKRAVVERDEMLATCVAMLRAAMAEHVAEPAWKSLVHRLSERSPEFVELWERRDVQSPQNRVKTLINDRVGTLRLNHTSLYFGPNLGVRMVTYTPADTETASRLDNLHTARRARSA